MKKQVEIGCRTIGGADRSSKQFKWHFAVVGIVKQSVGVLCINQASGVFGNEYQVSGQKDKRFIAIFTWRRQLS